MLRPVPSGPFIPGEIKEDEVKANYREGVEGVLEINAPVEKTIEESLPQRIEVEEINSPALE